MAGQVTEGGSTIEMDKKNRKKKHKRKHKKYESSDEDLLSPLLQPVKLEKLSIGNKEQLVASAISSSKDWLQPKPLVSTASPSILDRRQQPSLLIKNPLECPAALLASSPLAGRKLPSLSPISSSSSSSPIGSSHDDDEKARKKERKEKRRQKRRGRACVKIQKVWRGGIVRHKMQHQSQAITKIQAAVRGRHQRRKVSEYRANLAEKSGVLLACRGTGTFQGGGGWYHPGNNGQQLYYFNISPEGEWTLVAGPINKDIVWSTQAHAAKNKSWVPLPGSNIKINDRFKVQ